MPEQDAEVTAAACRYLMAGLLPRLERLQPGLLGEIRAGITADRDAMARAGALSPQVEAAVNEALQILALGAGSEKAA